MSHVIPLRVFQMLNSHRWDCNVLRCSLKLTVLNYVRLMFGSGPAAAHRHRGKALQALRRPPIGRGLSLFVASVLIAHRLAISHVIPLRVFQMLNSHRWDCNVLRCSLKLTVLNYVRILVSLGPAAAHRHRGQDRALKPGQDPSLRINVARNSLAVTSNHELTSLQLQRLWTVSKSDRVKLRANFGQSWPCRGLRALGAAPWPLNSRKCLLRCGLYPTRLNVTDGVDSSGLRPSGAVHAGGVVGIRD